MIVELKRALFGFDQNATVDVINKSDGVHIHVIKAEFPALIDHNVICKLVNDHRGSYDPHSRSIADNKYYANKGFLDKRITDLKRELGKAEFARLVAKRNKVLVFDKTNEST